MTFSVVKYLWLLFRIGSLIYYVLNLFSRIRLIKYNLLFSFQIMNDCFLKRLRHFTKISIMFCDTGPLISSNLMLFRILILNELFITILAIVMISDIQNMRKWSKNMGGNLKKGSVRCINKLRRKESSATESWKHLLPKF